MGPFPEVSANMFAAVMGFLLIRGAFFPIGLWGSTNDISGLEVGWFGTWLSSHKSK